MTAEFNLPLFNGNPACAEIGGDDWYPEPGGEGLMNAAAARRICGGCEIRVECLNWALDNGEGYGIWGGLTEIQRRAISHKRRRTA